MKVQLQNYIHIVYMYHISPSTCHHAGVIGRSLVFCSYVRDRSGYMSQTSQFSSYNYGGIYISHPRFHQEDILRGVQV